MASLSDQGSAPLSDDQDRGLRRPGARSFSTSVGFLLARIRGLTVRSPRLGTFIACAVGMALFTHSILSLTQPPADDPEPETQMTETLVTETLGTETLVPKTLVTELGEGRWPLIGDQRAITIDGDPGLRPAAGERVELVAVDLAGVVAQARVLAEATVLSADDGEVLVVAVDRSDALAVMAAQAEGVVRLSALPVDQ